MSRVVFQKPGRHISPHDPRIFGLKASEHDRVYMLHVTGDAGYWTSRLAKDYDRDEDHAWEVDIVVAEGDVLVDDFEYVSDPDTGVKASSAILLTSRKTLARDKDFFVNGKLSN